MSIAPVGGYLAVTGKWSDPWWMLVALALAVATWGGGFDVLYALQDVDFDRSERLYVAARGRRRTRALMISRGLHLMTVFCLAMVGAATFTGTNAGTLYAVGVVVAAGLLDV